MDRSKRRGFEQKEAKVTKGGTGIGLVPQKELGLSNVTRAIGVFVTVHDRHLTQFPLLPLLPSVQVLFAPSVRALLVLRRSLPQWRAAADLSMDPDTFQDAQGEKHQHQKRSAVADHR
jgi:hypothetical protein